MQGKKEIGDIEFDDIENRELDVEEFKKVLKTQNQNIVKIHLQRLKNQIKRMEEELQFITKSNKQIVIDLDGEENDMINKGEVSEESRKRYHQLFQKKHRYEQLQVLYQKLDKEKQYLNKNEKKKMVEVKGKEEYKVFRERKRQLIQQKWFQLIIQLKFFLSFNMSSQDQIPSSITSTRINRGNINFSIKWQSLSSSTYQQSEKLNNRKRILKFQKNMIQKLDPKKGSFTRQDQPLSILQVRKLEKDIEFVVEWQLRKNGQKPLNSIVTNEDFKIYDINFLIDFYESHFYFKNNQLQ